MEKILPKMLRKVSDGRLFPYSHALAKRGDMVPHWTDGVDPNAPKKLTGLEIEASRDAHIDALIAEKNKQISDMMQQISELTDQLQEQNDLIEKLNLAANAVPSPGTQDPISHQAEGRMDKIIAAVKVLVTDPNNLTGNNKVRIEPLEELTGVLDITAAERDEAMEFIGK